MNFHVFIAKQMISSSPILFCFHRAALRSSSKVVSTKWPPQFKGDFKCKHRLLDPVFCLNQWFVPIGKHTIATKRCSDDNSFVLQHNLYCQASVENVDINDFVSCLYENTRWIGHVMEIDSELTDVCVKFMHPHSPARSFNWPDRDDICWVPMVHILDKIDAPSTLSGRQYTLNPRDAVRIYANSVQKQ